MQLAFKSSRTSSGYERLLGHDCTNEIGMKMYIERVKTFTPDMADDALIIVPDDFDFGFNENGHSRVVTINAELPVIENDDGKFRTMTGKVLEDPVAQERYKEAVRMVLEHFKKGKY